METSDKTIPLPPPLPVHIKNRIHHKSSSQNASNSRGFCCPSSAMKNTWDHLFNECYRADVLILTDHGGTIYAHASILGIGSPVLRNMLKHSRCRGKKQRTISIRGVPTEAVRVFIRFLYSSSYDDQELAEIALPLLVLSHSYAVPQLKRLCELRLEQGLITTDNAVDVFQLALLCDAPWLSLISHRFIVKNIKAVHASEGWETMKASHPVLEKEILGSITYENARQKERFRKSNERKVYLQLYEAMEALVHICRDGCRTIGPHDKVLKDDQAPCNYDACKGLELLIRHFASCKMRGPGGCIHCKRMWRILQLHSHLCADSDACGVPLCRNFRLRRRKQSKKDEMKWRILVRKIVRSKSVTGAPFFSLNSS